MLKIWIAVLLVWSQSKLCASPSQLQEEFHYQARTICENDLEIAKDYVGKYIVEGLNQETQKNYCRFLPTVITPQLMQKLIEENKNKATLEQDSRLLCFSRKTTRPSAFNYAQEIKLLSSEICHDLKIEYWEMDVSYSGGPYINRNLDLIKRKIVIKFFAL